MNFPRMMKEIFEKEMQETQKTSQKKNLWVLLRKLFKLS